MTENRSQKPERKNPPEPDDPEQSKRFIETARQIEADETGEAFRRAFGNRAIKETDLIQ